ncbi:MAG TPA: hypothetical protein VK961_13180 [Chthoniobacter sp.]|nr:hypothetical protein [Chthoniobacter sp.]
MKFPLVFRSRADAHIVRIRRDHDTQLSGVRQNHDTQLVAFHQDHDAQLAGLRQEYDAKLAGLRQDHDAQMTELRREMESLLSHVREVERICEIRRTEVEQLKEVEKLCESRARAIATMRSERNLADHSFLRLLEELKSARQMLLAGGSVPNRSRMPLPLVFAVDLEPDQREVDIQDPSWKSAAEFFKRLPDLRARINALAGRGDPLVFTWLVRADPQIEGINGDTGYAFHHFAEELRTAIAAGDEIGLHVHPWRWAESQGRWMQDHGNDEWINHCIQVACDTYRNHFGKASVTHSSGDRFMNNAVVQKLNQMGVKIDLSLEQMPGEERLVHHELDTGSIPDTTSVPNRAYRPSAEDFRKPDPSLRNGVVFLPQTAHPGGHLSAWAPPAIFESALELTLMNPAELTHLALAIRTDIVLSPSWDILTTNLETLARHVKEGALQFATAERAWDRARKWLDGEAM